MKQLNIYIASSFKWISLLGIPLISILNYTC